MLPEKIYYPHDFPLTITIAELNEVPLHYHLDVELVVVLQGSITLKSGSCTYTLPKGSIFANNGREVHGFWKTDDSQSTIAVIQFNTAYFAQYFPRLSKVPTVHSLCGKPIHVSTGCGKKSLRSVRST